MEKPKILLNKDTVTYVLAMPTAGKSFFKKKVEGVSGVKIFDTDDFYDHDVKRAVTPEVKNIYLTGAFFITFYEANEWLRQHPEDKVILLSNLWYRPITYLVRFDYAVNVSAFRIHKLSESRGEAIPMETAKDWVISASEIWPKLDIKVIVLKDDEYLSDLVDLDLTLK